VPSTSTTANAGAAVGEFAQRADAVCQQANTTIVAAVHARFGSRHRGTYKLMTGILAAERPLQALRPAPANAHAWAHVMAERRALATTAVFVGAQRMATMTRKSAALASAASRLGVPQCGGVGVAG
jgi:hypothetical protein